jgi:hypothetical protein
LSLLDRFFVWLVRWFSFFVRVLFT